MTDLYPLLKLDRTSLRHDRSTSSIAECKYGLLTVLIGEIEIIQKRNNKSTNNINNNDVIKIIRSFLKGINDMIPLQVDDQRKSVLLMERDILNGYIPMQMSEFELRNVIIQIILNGGDNIGNAMKLLKENHEGLYDGRVASNIIKEVLAS